MNPFSLSVHGSLNAKMFHVTVCHQVRLQLFYSTISEEKLDLFGNKKYTMLRWLQGVTTTGGGGPLVRGICLLLSDRKALAVRRSS